MFCELNESTAKNPYITSVKTTPTKANTNRATKTKKQAEVAESIAPAAATKATPKAPTTTKKNIIPAQVATRAALKAISVRVLQTAARKRN